MQESHQKLIKGYKGIENGFYESKSLNNREKAQYNLIEFQEKDKEKQREFEKEMNEKISAIERRISIVTQSNESKINKDEIYRIFQTLVELQNQFIG